MAVGSRLTDLVSLGVLTSSVPRDAVDDAIAVTGRAARRSDGKLPPHVMVLSALMKFRCDTMSRCASGYTE